MAAALIQEKRSKKLEDMPKGKKYKLKGQCRADIATIVLEVENPGLMLVKEEKNEHNNMAAYNAIPVPNHIVQKGVQQQKGNQPNRTGK